MQDDLREINRELKELRLEIKSDLNRLEDKIDSKFLEINKDFSAFKRMAFTVILTIAGAIEAVKSKLGL